MWFFGKKKSEIIQEEVQRIFNDMINNTNLNKEMQTAKEISTEINDSFNDMNNTLLEVFDKSQQKIETNAAAITSIIRSLGYLLTAFYAIEKRIFALESQSVSDIESTKNNIN